MLYDQVTSKLFYFYLIFVLSVLDGVSLSQDKYLNIGRLRSVYKVLIIVYTSIASDMISEVKTAM